MAKRKNAVKSGLNQLRQALLQAKTAILNFSPEHILAVSYDPSSKATIVKDIPANLESQFTLGEGGGGGNSATPVLALTVINNSAYNCKFVDDFICIENNKYLKYYVWNNPILPNQTKEFLIPVTNHESESDYTFELPSPSSSGVTITVTDTVNCVYDENNLNAVITNLSEDASCTVTYE